MWCESTREYQAQEAWQPARPADGEDETTKGKILPMAVKDLRMLVKVPPTRPSKNDGADLNKRGSARASVRHAYPCLEAEVL